MPTKIAAVATQAVNQPRQRGRRSEISSIGNVKPQARRPWASVNVLATARTAQSRNFHRVKIAAPVATRASTRKSSGRNEGNPDAKSQSSNGAVENSARTMSQKQIASAGRFRPDLRSRTNTPAAVSQEAATDNAI